MPGAPDLSSFNLNVSAFQYNLKSNFFAECTQIAPASAPRKSGVEFVHEKAFRDLGSGFNIMTLTTFFWILVGASILVLMIIRFGIKKELLTPVFWLLIGISFMVLTGVLWNVIKGA